MSISYKIKYYMRELVKYTPLYKSIYRNIKINERKECYLKKSKRDCLLCDKKRSILQRLFFLSERWFRYKEVTNHT